MSPSGTVPISVSVLERYVDAGVFGPSEFHLAAMLVSVAERDARRVGREAPPVDDLVVLGVAVAARAPRSGHVCVDLDDVHRIVVDRRTDQSSDLTWPDTKRWAAALEGSELVADPSTAHLAPLRPLVWDGRRLYLRYKAWLDRIAGGVLGVCGAHTTSARRQAPPPPRFGPPPRGPPGPGGGTVG